MDNGNGNIGFFSWGFPAFEQFWFHFSFGLRIKYYTTFHPESTSRHKHSSQRRPGFRIQDPLFPTTRKRADKHRHTTESHGYHFHPHQTPSIQCHPSKAVHSTHGLAFFSARRPSDGLQFNAGHHWRHRWWCGWSRPPGQAGWTRRWWGKPIDTLQCWAQRGENRWCTWWKE